MCLRAVLGTRSSRGLKGVVRLGEDVGSPSPYLPAAEGKGVSVPVSMVGVQEGHGTSSIGWFLEKKHVDQE